MTDLAVFLRQRLRWPALFSLAINLALLAPSIYMLQVYDRVLVTRSIETLVMLTILTGVTLAAFGALDQVRSRLLSLVGMSLEQRFGPTLLSHLIVTNARQTTTAADDGLKDLSTLRNFLSGTPVVALFDAPWAVVYVLLIAAFDWRLGLLAIVSVLVLLWLTWSNNQRTRSGLDGTLKEMRAAGRWADRCLANAEVVTALGMSDTLSRRWAEQTASVHDRNLTLGSRTGVLSASTRTLRQMVQVLMMALGAWLVVHEGASSGVMLATTIILGRALAPIEQIIGSWSAFTEARLAFGRLDELLAKPPEGVVATTLPRPQGHLKVEGLTHVTPDSQRILLRQVSFDAAPGEIVALVGGSGAGKTTLARLLVGVLRPSAGVVRLDGADIRQYDPRVLGPALGYLPQDVELFSGTVAENIARFTQTPENDCAEAVIAAAKAAGVHELILRFPQGYDTQVGEGGRRLSGGQRQRVALARALYQAPAVVVLDEPDASLDSEGEDALMHALQGLKQRGTTVVAVTQRRRLLGVADKVIVMRDGQVERTATQAQLQAQAQQAQQSQVAAAQRSAAVVAHPHQSRGQTA